MNDRDLFRGLRPPAPPVGLRERALANAGRDGIYRLAPGLGTWRWLRPQLGWVSAALVLLAVHALLNVVWRDRRAAQGAPVPVSAARESEELTAMGVPAVLASRAEVATASQRVPVELARELM